MLLWGSLNWNRYLLERNECVRRNNQTYANHHHHDRVQSSRGGVQAYGNNWAHLALSLIPPSIRNVQVNDLGWGTTTTTRDTLYFVSYFSGNLFLFPLFPQVPWSMKANEWMDGLARTWNESRACTHQLVTETFLAKVTWLLALFKWNVTEGSAGEMIYFLVSAVFLLVNDVWLRCVCLANCNWGELVLDKLPSHEASSMKKRERRRRNV